MTVTIQQVRAMLDPEEPDYELAANLGPEALPHLEELVLGTDVMLASKATYLASLIDDPRSAELLGKAADSNRPEVRVAAASGAQNLAGESAKEVLTPLLGDHDVGVRKVALKSVPEELSPELREQVEALHETDPSTGIRRLSGEVLGETQPPSDD